MRTTVSITSQRITKQSQTRDQVFDLIESIGVGDAIPSERQLSQDFGVSRLTVRAAIDELVARGLPRAPARERHLRQRAEDRAGADDVLLQRGDAQARDAAGQQDALARGQACGRLSRALPPRLAVRADRRRHAAAAGRRRDDGDRDAARPRAARARADAPGLRRDLLLRPAHQPLRDRDRRRRPDDRAHGDERGGVRDPRRTAALARLPVRAHDAVRVGRHRRVRALDLPRRPLPARHRAEPARPVDRRTRVPASGAAP